MSSSSSSQFLWLSDVHYDPWYGSEAAVQVSETASCRSSNIPNESLEFFGQVGCDAPASLIENLLEHARTILPEPDFILITGDISRHHNDQLSPNPLEQTQQVIYNASSLIQAAFPSTTFAVSIGNNDVTPDYYLNVSNPTTLLNMVANSFAPFLEASNDDDNAQEIDSMLRTGGFYAVSINEHLSILCLNTIIYSTNLQPPTSLDDPLNQFAWMRQQFQQAADSNKRLLIAGHIPPTIGSFRHTQLWQETYLDTYYEIVQSYSHVLAGQAFGHIHTDEFRYHKDLEMFMTSSITPIYGSNPSFRIVTYDPQQGTILDYDTHYVDLGDATSFQPTNASSNLNWKQAQSFRQDYQVPDLSVASLASIVDSLASDPNDSLWNVLLARQHIYAHGSETCNALCRKEWVCTLQSLTAAQFATCLVTPTSSSSPMAIAWIVLCVLASLTGVSALVWALRRYAVRKQYDTPGDDNVTIEAVATPPPAIT